MSFQSSKHEYHALKMVVPKDNLFSEEVEAHTWTDNAPVMVLSAVHEPGSKAVKSEGNERVREAFGDAEKDMRIPPCINDYNQHMSGAGIAFSEVIRYSTANATNSYFTFQDMPQTPHMTHREFRPGYPGTCSISPQSGNQKSARSAVGENASLHIGRSCGRGHLPIHYEAAGG